MIARIQYLDQVIAQPDFWNNPTPAYETLQEIEYSIFYKHQQYQRMRNKEKALVILKSKLFAMPTAGYAYALVQSVQLNQIQPRQIKSLSNKLIREYILHPYTKVKDLRTNVETTAAAEVLDGKIDLFIKAYLQQPSQTK